MSDDDFAFWAENALWMHSQNMMAKSAGVLGMLGGGEKK